MDVKTFNSAYNRTLLGTKKVPDIEVTVNWLPDNTVHLKLKQLADDQKRAQFRVTYFDDAAHTNGYFEVYTAFVSTTTKAGDKDQVVTMAVTLAVDGGAVAEGVYVPPSP
ncbi:phage tail tube protein [Klebsiella aerogenes]